MYRLPASQIDEINDRRFGHFFSGIVFGLLHKGDAHDGVGSGGGGIHVGRGDSAVDSSFLDLGINFLVTANHVFLQTIGCD